jgi:hypothetical protein
MFSTKWMPTTFAVSVLAVVPGFTGTNDALAPRRGVGQTMTVSPTTLQPGDSFVVQNDPSSPCLLGEVIGDTGGMTPGAWVTTPDGSGNWSITLQVPTEGPPDPSGNPTPFPPGDYEIHAFCQAPMNGTTGAGFAARQQVDFEYDPVTVTVVPAAPEPPSTPEAPPAPDAAGVVTATPTFTG